MGSCPFTRHDIYDSKSPVAILSRGLLLFSWTDFEKCLVSPETLSVPRDGDEASIRNTSSSLQLSEHILNPRY